MPLPNRRVLIVLGSLLGAMTLASGILLALEPRPISHFAAVPLQSVDQVQDRSQRLFDTAPVPVPERWSAIVIHDSGEVQGTPQSIVRQVRSLTEAYHFVVSNGQFGRDGQIEISDNWSLQRPRRYIRGVDHDEQFSARAIGICLIGDTQRQPLTEVQQRELLWLVRELQARFNIPPEQVWVSSSGSAVEPVASGAHGTPGSKFDDFNFRRQLLTERIP